KINPGVMRGDSDCACLLQTVPQGKLRLGPAANGLKGFHTSGYAEASLAPWRRRSVVLRPGIRACLRLHPTLHREQVGNRRWLAAELGYCDGSDPGRIFVAGHRQGPGAL